MQSVLFHEKSLSWTKVTVHQKLRHLNAVMIESESQLQQAIEQIENLCRALNSLRAGVFPKNPRNFAILAEGPVDEIRKLQADVDDYLSRLEGMPADAPG